MKEEIEVEKPDDSEYGDEKCTCKDGHTDCTFPSNCTCLLHYPSQSECCKEEVLLGQIDDEGRKHANTCSRCNKPQN